MAPPVSRLGVQKEMKGDTDRKADPNCLEGLPDHLRFCSAITAAGKNKKEGMLRVVVFIFLSNHDA